MFTPGLPEGMLRARQLTAAASNAVACQRMFKEVLQDALPSMELRSLWKFKANVEDLDAVPAEVCVLPGA